MNKTVNINLAGMVFHINEDAFEILNNYLNTLKNHFKNEEGGDEILKDIEGRIAELFTGRLDKKEAISLTDINEIITIMGDPSQYDDEIEQGQSQESQNKEEDLRKGKKRKVYRDGDGKMIGGVCSGMAHYFDISVFWSRIIFFFLLFIMGPGAPFIYIMLWIALPSAKTTAEKLEMKGEKVNINNIEKNIKDELNILDKKYTNEIFGANSFFRKIVDFCIRVITGIFKFTGSCFGIFFILFGGILLFLIFSFVFSGAEILFQNHPMVEHVYSNFFNNKSATWFSLFIGIPIVAIILFGLRLVNNTKIHMNYKIGIFVLWIISLFFLLNSAKDISIEFQEEAKNTIIKNIITESDTLYLSMNDVNRELVKTIPGLIPQFKVTPFEDNLIGIGMQLDVVKSKNDNFNLIKEVIARGKNKQIAKERTEEVGFEFLLEDDNLIFDDFFTISTQKWRMQELDLTLEIPVGMVVFLDHSL
ncbi:MAG: PspC domain-containing protein, partial [Flavobacteriales bacterium]|nr:PspC domain-containing protein [Flavobacteriales bacterium]